MPKSPSTRRIPTILLTTAIALAIHSTLHAATDIESGTPGTGQDASASVTSSDPANTITATAGSGASDGNGGNATASAILTPTTDSASTLTAIGGMSGTNNISLLPTIGGNATASATVNASGNVTLSLTAIGGVGDTSSINGTGGNATASASVIATGNISINVTSQGGTAGGFTPPPPFEGAAGVASIGSISATSSSGNITLVANDLGGLGNLEFSGFGIGADAAIANPFSASTTGNITLTQNANAGEGRLSGNANSTLTFTNVSAASITATANANSNASTFFPSTNTGNNPYGGATAYANITGAANVTATATATSINADAPASATAIARGSPFPATLGIPHQMAINAYATATTGTTASALAMSYSGDPYFSSADVFASSNVSGQTISAGFQTPSFATSAVEGFFPLTAPVSSTNSPDTKALAAITTQVYNNGQSIQHSRSFSSGFEGVLDTSMLPEQDWVIKIISQGGAYHALQLTFFVNQIIIFSQSYTTQDLVNTFSHPLVYDLGPLKNFGNGPLDIKLEVDITLPGNTGIVIDPTTVILYDMNPALLTPEPASLSLLTAATLPLLLKRRRQKNQP